jgi:hypothetical protein
MALRNICRREDLHSGIGTILLRERARGRGCRDSISRRQNLLVESVCVRAICLPSSADEAKSERKSCSRSVENLVSPWNGYSQERSSSDMGPALLFNVATTHALLAWL